MKKSMVYVVLASAIISASLIVVGVFLGIMLSNGNVKSTADYSYSKIPIEATEEEPTGGENGTIAIPGYEKLVMKAGELKQTVNFENPVKNNCYFRISIILDSGIELYSSGLIKPGQTLETIEIHHSLEKGDYKDTILQYDCYSLDDLSPLNGAKSKLNLEVIP